MESDQVFRRFKERQARFYEQLERLRRQSDSIIDSLQSRGPSAVPAQQLVGLSGEQERLLQEYAGHVSTFAEHLIKVQESEREAEVTQKRPAAPSNQAQIDKLSAQLTTELRLERVDDAIKELLAFLAD